MSASASTALASRAAVRPRRKTQAKARLGKTSAPDLRTKTVATPTVRDASKAAAPRDKALPQSEPNGHDADQALVVRAQEGDQLAFELLVRKYQNRVIQLVQRLVGEADAPDVAQEAFMKAYRGLRNFRGQSSFFTWLYRVAINAAKNHLMFRSRRLTAQHIDVDDAEKYGHEEYLSDYGTPEAFLLAEEIQGTVAAVMRKLPEDLRGAITLREIEGFSYEEIAEVMSCPIGTVRSRIFRAREAIDVAVSPLLLNG